VGAVRGVGTPRQAIAMADLVLACHSNELERAALLLASGAGVDHAMKNGATPLMVASIGGHLELVTLLLSYGAVIDREMKGGATALMMATFYRQTAIESLLLSHGAAANTPQGQVALLLACVDVDLDLGTLLLESMALQAAGLQSLASAAAATDAAAAAAVPDAFAAAGADGDGRQNSHIRPGYTNLFIGELGRTSNEESVRAHFRRFGDVDRVVVKHSANSSFAFVSTNGELDLIFSMAHMIDGHKVATPALAAQGPHKTRAKEGDRPGKARQGGCRKIFVGGLSHHTKESALRVHFGQFGELVDVVVMHDPGAGKPRGFGFVTFAEPESAISVISTGRYHNVDGRAVEVKLAIPRGHMPPEGKAVNGPQSKQPGQSGGFMPDGPTSNNWIHEASTLQLIAGGGSSYVYDGGF